MEDLLWLLWYNRVMDSLYILLAFFFGWLVAQVTKVILVLIFKRGKVSFKELVELLMRSGGMPSSHTACFTAATLTIGFRCGFDSALFALAICNTAIIIYDATNVRYAVGQQGKLLNKIAKNTETGKPLKLVEGHTVIQTIVGFMIGVIVALVIEACK